MKIPLRAWQHMQLCAIALRAKGATLEDWIEVLRLSWARAHTKKGVPPGYTLEHWLAHGQEAWERTP